MHGPGPCHSFDHSSSFGRGGSFEGSFDYGARPGESMGGRREWPSYAGVQNETMAELRGERTLHGLNSAHCLWPTAPAGYAGRDAHGGGAPLTHPSPTRGPERYGMLAHAEAHLPRPPHSADLAFQRSDSWRRPLPMTSYDAALQPRSRGSGPMPGPAGAVSSSASPFQAPSIGVLPCRPLFPEGGPSPVAPAPRATTPPLPRPPPGALASSERPPRPGSDAMDFANQFKDSSSYLESHVDPDIDDAEVAATETERIRRRSVKERNRSPSRRMQSCMPCLVTC